MTADKTIVVGGGIVGITAAYFARQRGDDVVLIEADNCLGGLLRSDCNAFGCFDYGTHVASQTGVVELDHFLFSDFSHDNAYIFDTGKSGNFFQGQLSDISPYVNTALLKKEIFHQGCVEVLQASNQPGDNLAETLMNRYGKTLYHHIFQAVIDKNFGCSAQRLANIGSNFFDMGRALVFDRQTSEQLKKLAQFDAKIGFHHPVKGGTKYYPKSGGIGQWIKHLTKKLSDAGVVIKTKTQLTDINVMNDGQFHCASGNETFSGHHLVWTLSSGLLNRFIATGIAGQRPKFRKTMLYDFVFDQPLKTESYYINVYDVDFLASRITNYQNLQSKPTFYACTVELLKDDDFAFDQALPKVERELFDMGLVAASSRCIYKQQRPVKEGFPVLTVENVDLLNQINDYYQAHYPNITLLGRSSAKGFFMSELLLDAYRKIR